MGLSHRNLDRDKVLAEASAMVMAHGVQDFSFQTLAKQLDIRSQSLYNYFRNSDEVIEALGENFMTTLYQQLTERLTGIAGKSAIQVYAQTVHHFFEQHGLLTELIYFVHRFPENSPFVQATSRIISLLKRLIDHVRLKHMAKTSFVQNFVSSVLGFTELEVMGFLPDTTPSRTETFSALLNLYMNEVY